MVVMVMVVVVALVVVAAATSMMPSLRFDSLSPNSKSVLDLL